MAAYVIVQVEVTDPERFGAYLRESPAIIKRYGGEYLARGGETVILEGDEPARRMVIIEFPSLEQAQAWYNSPEYQQAKTLRNGAAVGSLIAIDGCQRGS